MAGPKAIVLRAAGTNCDYETAFALKTVGFATEVVHVNELATGRKKLSDYRLLAIPGGFSYGDYIGSGKVLANKLAYKLGSEMAGFIKSGNLVIGICNGFQVLVKAGLLPAASSAGFAAQEATLTFNSSGSFQCEWVELKNVSKGNCVFTKGIKSLHCPIAHGEGRFVPADRKLLKRLYENDQVVFKYVKNPNGSVDSIAGICDTTGRVFGMMPHPERNLFSLNDPRSLRVALPAEGEGFAIFRNAFKYAEKTEKKLI